MQVPLVDVVRSPRRRRGGSISVRDGRVVVRVPAGMAPQHEATLVESLMAKLIARAHEAPPIVAGAALPDAVDARDTRSRRGPRGDVRLVERADVVADRWLDGLRASDVRWSTRMNTRWASCSVQTGRIRVSDRLADAPDVVLDHILLHELAHLRVPDHSAPFRALLARDPAGPAVDAWLLRRSRLELRAVLGLV